jgi:uncharacterized sporulation protein YeaH/YhbH (DUF444 family)
MADDKKDIYKLTLEDLVHSMTGTGAPAAYYYNQLKTIDELLERDKIREKDGFPRKIRLGRLIKPGKGGKNSIIMVPTTVEEKFYHGDVPVKKSDQESDSQGEGDGQDQMAGTGDGDEGDIIGEAPIHQEGPGDGGAGQGDGEGHDITSHAYDLGKILTEKLQLPNLKDKGKKKTFTRFKYDLTDKNRGFGQVLDKKATLKRIIRTNQSLGRLDDPASIDTTRFLIDPRDRVYRILSREKDYESQALIFFLRDYSGSMYGKTTEVVISQHLMIYSWLTYQYENRVETRFILHDSEAKEVPDFYTYYNLSIAGGTYIASAYKLVNELVKKEGLARDYNIYIFHGTDGDDMDSQGDEALEEMREMLTYASRIGITVVSSGYRDPGNTTVESYMGDSGLLREKKDLLRLSSIPESADERTIIDGIKDLVSEE